jgi:hypothetical protein
MTLRALRKGRPTGRPQLRIIQGGRGLADPVPPFDPRNPRHVRAWEMLYRLGQEEQKRREGR